MQIRRLGMTVAALLLVFGVAPRAVPEAAAAVDLSNLWRVIATGFFLPPDGLVCQITIVQSGSSIDLNGPCDLLGTVSLSGTINPADGTFTASGSSAPFCPSLSVSGTGAPDSLSFSGSVACTGGPLPVVASLVGSLCGNGNLDPNEQCDAGSANGIGCCDAHCQFVPSGYQQALCRDTDCSTGKCDGAGQCTVKPRASGTRCQEDGNVCTDDKCNGSGACTHVPNARTCDDGNVCTLSDRCAGGACVGGPPAPAGARCNLDNDLCTEDACDGAGACAAGPCSPCCDQTAGCVPAIEACTRPVVPRATLGFTGNTAPKLRRIQWKWAKGTADKTDFGDPVHTTDYNFCLYETVNNQTYLFMDAKAPAGGQCGAKSCWSEQSGGFKYSDNQETPDGLQSIQLKAGAAGAAGILLRGKGPNLQGLYPSFVDLPLTAQLKAGNNQCWQAQFATAVVSKNGRTFRAKNGSPSGAFLEGDAPLVR
jgi:hypothetical protein